MEIDAVAQQVNSCSNAKIAFSKLRDDAEQHKTAVVIEVF